MSMLRLWAIPAVVDRTRGGGPTYPRTLSGIDGTCNDDLAPAGYHRRASLLCAVQPIDNRPNLAKHAPPFRAIVSDRLGMREMPRRRYGDFLYLRLAIIGIRVTASIAVVGYAGATSAGDHRHADLFAYDDIFTSSAPRPPRSVPNAGVKGDHSGSSARTRPPRQGDSAVWVQQPPHPSAQMFPPVTPLE
jgi:hypothetical protein